MVLSFAAVSTLFCRGITDRTRVSEEIRAQRDERTSPAGSAVLDTGPELAYGILILPPNALSFYRGEYVDGSALLTVLYTEEVLAPPEDWTTTRCSSEALRFVTKEGRLHYLYVSDDGWSVFFEIPRSYERACPFIERFLQRLRFFKGVGASEIVPFPAIVELPTG